MKKEIGKKVRAAAICAAAVLCLAGCGKAGNSEAASNGSETESTGSAAETQTSNTASGDIKTALDIDVTKHIDAFDYKAIKVEVSPVTEVDESYLASIANQQYSSLAGSVASDAFVLDRAVESGDIINLDYSGKKDGVVFDGGTAQNQTLWIGSHTFIDGFEDGLIGVKPGETVDLNLRFPDSYGNAELAGAEVVFTCTVNGIISEDAIIDVFNENYSSAEPVSGYEGLVDYLRNYLKRSYENQHENELNSAIVQQLIDTIVVKEDFPDALKEVYKNRVTEELQTNADYYGYTIDEYCQNAVGKNADEYIDQAVSEQLKMDAGMILIANNENLMISDEEMETRLKDMLAAYGYTDYEAALEELSIDVPTYKVYFLEEDVLEYLKGVVEISEK